MPRRSPRKHAGSMYRHRASAALAMLAAASPPPAAGARPPSRALLGSDSSDGEEEVVESGAVTSPPARKRQKNAENVSPASREEADLLRAALESPAGGALFAWNGGGPQSFQTPPSKDSSFRDDDEEASVPRPGHRPSAVGRRLAMDQGTNIYTTLLVVVVALEHDAPLLRRRDDVLVAQQGLVGDELERLDVLLHGREDDVLRLRRSPHVAEGQAVRLDRNQSDLRFRVERRQRERVGRLLEGALN